MTRYLYSQDGQVIGYMDNNDGYLYSQEGQVIAYWDSQHKYMYKQSGQVYGYLASGGQYLYAQSGEVIGVLPSTLLRKMKSLLHALSLCTLLCLSVTLRQNRSFRRGGIGFGWRSQGKLTRATRHLAA